MFNISDKDVKEIPSSSFDPVWYLSYYGDVREEGIDATLHYLRHGIYEGRFPTEAAFRTAQFIAGDAPGKRLIREVCNIVSSSATDEATIDRYHSSLIQGLENIVGIAQELVNMREVVDRAIALEKQIRSDRRMKARAVESTEALDASQKEKRPAWEGRSAEPTRLESDDLELSNILVSERTIDMGVKRVQDEQENSENPFGASLADVARQKRIAIFKSI